MTPRIIKVAPSILAIDYNNDEILDKALADIEKAKANYVHLDVMDGKFVPNKTFNHKLVDKIRDKTSLMLDVHLMVENPDKVIDDYAEAGADIITVHYEACKDVHATLKKISDKNIVAGLAISPKTPVIKIKDYLDEGIVDIIVVMGVKPGACGQTFIPGSAEKVAEIRELNKKVYIEIDGGVTLKNAALLRKMGVNIIVSGSTIFNSKNMKKTIQEIKGNDFLSKILKKF